MKKALYFAIVLVTAFMFIGCGGSTRTCMPGIGIGGIGFEQLKRNEYEVLDTVEGSGTLITILGIPVGSNKYGDIGSLAREEKPNGAGEYMLSVLGSISPNVCRGEYERALNMAQYDALKKVPEADAILPLSVTKETYHWFWIFRVFYSEETATVKGRAIRIKSDLDLKCERKLAK